MFDIASSSNEEYASMDDDLWSGKQTNSQKVKDDEASRISLEVIAAKRVKVLDPKVAHKTNFRVVVKELRKRTFVCLGNKSRH